MAALVLLFFLLFTIGGSEAAWCVCRSDQPSTTLQKTIDYACGAGADCTPIMQNGPCYNPDTVVSHCSYAANSYYQRKGQTQDACNFMGAATLSSTDPSFSGCTFPATPSAAGTSTTGTTPPTGTPTGTTPTTGTPPGSTPMAGTPPGTTTPSTFTPTGTTTPGGTTGGVLGGLGPTGTGSLDGTGTDSGFVPNPCFALIFISSLVSLVVSLVV